MDISRLVWPVPPDRIQVALTEHMAGHNAPNGVDDVEPVCVACDAAILT